MHIVVTFHAQGLDDPERPFIRSNFCLRTAKISAGSTLVYGCGQQAFPTGFVKSIEVRDFMVNDEQYRIRWNDNASWTENQCHAGWKEKCFYHS